MARYADPLLLQEIPTFRKMSVPSKPSGTMRQKTGPNFTKALNN